MANLLISEIQSNRSLVLPGTSPQALPHDVAEAIISYPGAFRAGAVGPDFYPDTLFGQTVIHAENSGQWIEKLFSEYGRFPDNHPEKKKIYAFILGFMVHYAGDMYGHYYVNDWAKGWWEFSLSPEKMKIIARHLLIEAYMDRKVPNDICTDMDAPVGFLQDFFLSTSLRGEYAKGPFKMPIDAFVGLEEAIAKCANKNELRTLDFANYFPGWQHDIRRASREWIEAWQQVAHIFSDSTHSIKDAKEVLDGWVSRNFLLMVGVPKWADAIISSIGAILDAINILKPIEKMIKDIIFNYMSMFINVVTGGQVKNLDEAITIVKQIMGDPGLYLNNGMLYSDYNITALLDIEMGNYGKSNNTLNQTFHAFYQCLNMCKLCLIGPSNLNNLMQSAGSNMSKRYISSNHHRGVRHLKIRIKTMKNNYNPFSSSPATCGTDDNVYFGFIMKNGQVFETILDTPFHNDFESDNIETFIYDLPQTISLPDIAQIRLRKDYMAVSDDWMPQWIELYDEAGNNIFNTDIKIMLKDRTPWIRNVSISFPMTTVSIDPSIISFLYSLDGKGRGSANPTSDLPWDNAAFPFYSQPALRSTLYKKFFETRCPESTDLSGWESLGGIITSGPDACSWEDGRLDVFARGTDNALWHKWYDGKWNNWESLGGIITSDPSAACWGVGRIDVFARGTDNALWHKWFTGGWSGWESLGGTLVGGPDVCSWGAGRLDIFVRGTDNALWHKWFDGQWSNWESLGGILTSDPSAVCWSNGRIDVFVRGTDNGLWHKWYNGAWSGWESLGGVLTSGPDVSSWGEGRLDVFARGSGNVLMRKAYDKQWSEWEIMDGTLLSDPSAVSMARGRISVFTRGKDNALWHKDFVTGNLAIRLKAFNGQYVCAENGGGGVVVANRQVGSVWETFLVHDKNGGKLLSGDGISLSAFRGQFLCAENGGGREIVANRNLAAQWEQFTIVKAQGSGEIRHGDKVRIRCANGMYLCAENGGGREVVANRPAADVWETFTIEFVERQNIVKGASLVPGYTSNNSLTFAAWAGFNYDDNQRIFYSRTDAWQRNLGYFTLYDMAAPFACMFIHCEPIRFSYGGKSWKIELWKGQYGICTGAEIGIYTGEFQINTGMGSIDHTLNQIKFQNDTACAGDADMLQMSFTLKRNGKVVFSRNSDDPKTAAVEKHWWLTGFRPFAFSAPSDLTMDITIEFKDEAMRNAFCDGLARVGYNPQSVIKNGKKASFTYAKPYTSQPWGLLK